MYEIFKILKLLRPIEEDVFSDNSDSQNLFSKWEECRWAANSKLRVRGQEDVERQASLPMKGDHVSKQNQKWKNKIWFHYNQLVPARQWWHISVILAVESLKQEDSCEPEATLGLCGKILSHKHKIKQISLYCSGRRCRDKGPTQCQLCSHLAKPKHKH